MKQDAENGSMLRSQLVQNPQRAQKVRLRFSLARGLAWRPF